MAVNEIDIEAAPAEVWRLLADPQAYAGWVVGTKRIRDADEGFPDPGTRFYHTVGVGPLTLSDSTEVLRSEPDRLLVLEARLGPLGSARVEIELGERAGGTHVVLRETGSRGPNRVLRPAGELLLRGPTCGRSSG